MGGGVGLLGGLQLLHDDDLRLPQSRRQRLEHGDLLLELVQLVEQLLLARRQLALNVLQVRDLRRLSHKHQTQRRSVQQVSPGGGCARDSASLHTIFMVYVLIYGKTEATRTCTHITKNDLSLPSLDRQFPGL